MIPISILLISYIWHILIKLNDLHHLICVYFVVPLFK